MEKDVVIKVDNVSKKFTSSIRRSMLHGTTDIAKSMLGIRPKTSSLRKGEFWSLDNINFELKKGEALGLLGVNGSGKSTLLRLLTGIYPPDKGRITIRGKIGALIAVGAGFHPHMTGRENVYLNGIILGMTRKEVDEKMSTIIDFADIGQFIDAPVSTYSSGMNVRLGFAIAINAVPEILLIDEILAVGDMRFQQKCMAKISEVMERGTTIILVSHAVNYIQNLCTKALLLDHGQQIIYGDPVKVIAEYLKRNSDNSQYAMEDAKNTEPRKDYGIKYNYIKFTNSKGEETRTFTTGETINVEWEFTTKKPLEDIGLVFSLSDGPYTYNGYMTRFSNIVIDKVTSRIKAKLTLENVALAPSKYIVSIAINDKRLINSYFWDYETPGTIEIVSTRKLQGRFEFPHKWELDYE